MAARARYRVHRFDLSMTRDQANLERFLNDLDGEIIAVIPNVTMWFFWAHRVDFVLVVERAVAVAADDDRSAPPLAA